MATEEAANDMMRARERAAPLRWSANPGYRAVALSISYIALYLALDRLSFIGALHGIGITPWSPTAGLAMALLISKGLRYAPLVMAAELLSGTTLPIMSFSAAPIFLGSLVVTAGYTGAAAILRHAGFQAGLRRSSDVVVLLIVTIISSALVAGGFVVVYATAGVVPWSGFAEAGFHFWTGDAIGIVVLLPPLLLACERIKQRALPVRGRASFRIGEAAAQGASIVAALTAVFSGMGGDYPLGLFYLLFPPLIWIAMRHGLSTVTWAVLAIQIGLIAGLETQGHSELTLRAFQLFMFALAATGLMLGAVVSERRRLSLTLLDSEGLRTAILNTVPDGVLTIDARGRIQSINPAVEKLFSHPSHRLIGRDVSELIEDVPDLLQRVKLAAHLPAAKTGGWELNARRADGSTFPMEFSAGRFSLLGTEHYTVVVRDIASRREAEVRDRQHQAQLAHVSRVSLAGEMAAGLAHELSQPLTAIIAYARGCLRLLAGPVPEPALLHEGIGEVVQQAERAGDVLDRLREFVRGGEFRRALTKIKPLIDAVISLTRTEAMQQDVEIEAKVDPGLPVVLADQVQIEQVLLNLLRNAMEAMEAANSKRRSIIIEARRNSRQAIEISVADSGPGVAAEVTDTIFEPFVTSKPFGMGMGLSISRAIIESHGGRLRMVREVRLGATFVFDLPTAEAEASSDKAVFVVDDDAPVRQGLRFMLRAAGYSVEAFPSAPSFLEGYDPRRGGCLLLDIQMPQMTGLELQQQLNVRGWRIPVIFITGHGTVSLAIAAMKAGAFDFIEKPLREDVLLDSIERALHWNDRAYEERLERATLQVRAALLTPREREIFDLVATGEPNKVIARNPVLRALREHGIEVTAIHNHMLDDQPHLYFMHFWANDDAKKLAEGLKAALAQINIAKS